MSEEFTPADKRLERSETDPIAALIEELRKSQPLYPGGRVTHEIREDGKGVGWLGLMFHSQGPENPYELILKAFSADKRGEIGTYFPPEYLSLIITGIREQMGVEIRLLDVPEVCQLITVKGKPTVKKVQ